MFYHDSDIKDKFLTNCYAVQLLFNVVIIKFSDLVSDVNSNFSLSLSRILYTFTFKCHLVTFKPLMKVNIDLRRYRDSEILSCMLILTHSS